MSYISISFYILLAVIVLSYYVLPKNYRWIALFFGSVFFYYSVSGSVKTCVSFALTILLGWLFGFLVERQRNRKSKAWFRWILCFCILIPLILFKLTNGFNFLEDIFHRHPWLAPLGISYFSLQLYSYLRDIDSGKISPQKNPLKFMLYMSFFPQVVQGPIPRYDELSGQLFDGNRFESTNMINSMELVTWGFFLKFMIADKALVVVDQIYNGYLDMTGSVILLGAVLYCIQLYSDFLACVTISQGVAYAFGIRLNNNFRHPFFAPTVQDFWRRWHISLSYWLRDYVYIALGGSRKGTIRKYFNLCVTFILSGIWHGGLALHYLVWGLLQAVLQIIGGTTIIVRNKALNALKISPQCIPIRFFRAAVTSGFFVFTQIIFRAESLSKGFFMIQKIFTGLNWTELKSLMPTIIDMGAFMDPEEWYVLFISIAVLLCISLMQSRICIREYIRGLWLPVRWIAYIAPVLVIVIFGSYGYGFNAADFIYGGF